MVVPPRTPTCRISGVIVKVDFEEAYVRGDEGAANPPGWVPGTTSPALYRLRILVREVAYGSGDDGEETCEERYPPGREDVFTLNEERIRQGDALREGRSIRGEVWNGHLTSCELVE